MPDRSDDDAPREPRSEPSEDVPRREPPSAPSDDTPRWEPPPPSREPPRWQPPAEATDTVPRWEPDREVPRWQPPTEARAPGHVGVEEPARRRPPPPKVSPLVVPFRFWRRHPWVAVWAGVFLAPGAVLLLRIADESGLERLVQPLEWLFIAVFGVALALAANFSLHRSLARLGIGVVSALVAAAVLLWPVTHVVLGRVNCPPRAGRDLGVMIAAGAIDVWQRGQPGGEGWRTGEADIGWIERSRAIRLLDYQLVESGCWERVAPIDASRTWHDFRVTIQEGDRQPLSKVVVVHTTAVGDGWKITAIEGPLP
jgi:hypothetical protein